MILWCAITSLYSKKMKTTKKHTNVKKQKKKKKQKENQHICSVCLCLVSVHTVILSQCMVVNYGGNVLSYMDELRSVVEPSFVHPLINCNSEVVIFIYFIYFLTVIFFYFTLMDTVVMCFVYKSLIKFFFLKKLNVHLFFCVSSCVCVGHVSFEKSIGMR